MKRLLSLVLAVGLVSIIAISTTKAVAVAAWANASVSIVGKPGVTTTLKLSKTGEAGTWSTTIGLDHVSVPSTGKGTSQFFTTLELDSDVKTPDAAGQKYRLNTYGFNTPEVANTIHVKVFQFVGPNDPQRVIFDGTLAQLQSDTSSGNYVVAGVNIVGQINIVYSPEKLVPNSENVATPDGSGALTFQYVLTVI